MWTPARELTKVLSLLPAGAYRNFVDFVTYGFFAMAATMYDGNVPVCIQQIMNAVNIVNVDGGAQAAAVRVMSPWAD